jgi:AcrR family transcriptional regulator
MTPRPRPPQRFAQIVSAAADIFITHGYRRTQMQDVADALGVAKGTLYGYVDGKEALLAAALRYADEAEPQLPDAMPLPAPAPGGLGGLVADRLAGEIRDMRLTQVLADGSSPAPDGPAVAEELAAIITDLYQRLARHRVAIKLADRCAPELPELAEVWFGQGRANQVSALTDYLSRRAETGALRLPGPAPILARTMLETCVLWAVHLHWDPTRTAGPPIDDSTVAATLARTFTHGLVRQDHHPDRPA